jgi:RNA polymerase sigma-70 factor (ECF subfamily)
VLRLCRLLLADPHEAEEVGQEVFLKMFQVYEAQNWPAAWGPWVTRVAVNACHDRRRSGWWKWWRTSGQEFQETDYPNRGRTPEEEVVGQEERGRIWRSFRELSARQQEVFILRHLEEWSTEEVAKTLGISSGSVKRHLFRAVCHLRKVLGGRL